VGAVRHLPVETACVVLSLPVEIVFMARHLPVETALKVQHSSDSTESRQNLDVWNGDVLESHSRFTFFMLEFSLLLILIPFGYQKI